jgi:hypothetical protein
MSDERRVLDHPLAVDFDEFVEIDPPWQPRAAPLAPRDPPRA